MTAPHSQGAMVACACKGIRHCLVCETLKGKVQIEAKERKVVHQFLYDPESKRAVCKDAEATSSFPFPGVFLWDNFISEEEEKELISSMDQDVWNLSQSGRRKQSSQNEAVIVKHEQLLNLTFQRDFGPKVNFKKKKVHVGNFSGLPAVSQHLILRMQREQTLADFQPVEQCNLDYHPERGSAIDPHLDDSWLWGERLVTVNMLSDTTLTMSMEQGLPEVGLTEEVQVAVHLPRRSLVVLSGFARHRWKHAIHRKDVHSRRVCSTYRELSAEFLPGGRQGELGAQLLHIAHSFTGTPL